jgi:serine/threonine-protein phosphatase 2A regulatory subunit B''
MLDMIKPVKRDCITLSDLKKCKMTPIFFDTFFNLEKYMEHEQKDPFTQKENGEVTFIKFNLILKLIHKFLVDRLGSLRCTRI